MAVSSDGEAVYVGEIGPNRVWKFSRHKGEREAQDYHSNVSGTKFGFST